MNLSSIRRSESAMTLDRPPDLSNSDRDAAAYLAAIVDSSDDAIISKNLNGIIQTWNNGAERIFGYTASEAVGQSILLLIPPDRHQEEATILARLKRGERIEHYETVRRCKDGRHLDISLTVSPVRGADGRILGASKIVRDITERKKAEASIQQLNAELEARVHERTRELMTSHERHRALVAQLRLTEQRERRHLATRLHDSLAQSLALVRIKLHQTKQRVSSGEDALTRSVADLEELVQQCLIETRTLMAQLRPAILHDCGLVPALRWLAEQMAVQGLEVEVHTAEGMRGPRLGEDREDLLFNAVRELLINVRKHAGIARAKVCIDQPGTGDCHITVSDDGRGFDPTQMETNPSGEHFGLSCMHERMEIISGRCVIESSPGAGTTVRLEVPLLETPVSSEAVLPSAAVASSVSPRRCRILLVDDHAMVRQELRSVLATYPDLEVVAEAVNGEEAVACAVRDPVDVVLMDLTLPQLNGIEATRRIKEARPTAIVIGLSVQALPPTRDALLDAGAAELISKEVAAEELYRTIVQLVGGSGHPSDRGSRLMSETDTAVLSTALETSGSPPV
jgi:PAS domain S-box-containing protein